MFFVACTYAHITSEFPMMSEDFRRVLQDLTESVAAGRKECCGAHCVRVNRWCSTTPVQRALLVRVSGIAQTPHNWQKRQVKEAGSMSIIRAIASHSMTTRWKRNSWLDPLLSVQGHPDPRYSRRLWDDHKKCNAFTTNTTIFTLKWAAL